MSQTVYAYTDLNRVQKMVDDGDINYTGTWSSSGTYEAASRDVVLYGSSKYITLVDNVGANPTATVRRNQTAKWSSLVTIRTGTTTSVTAAEAYAYAGSALAVAQAGSNTANGAFEAAVVAQDTADLAIQWIGTISASNVDQVARDLAAHAFSVAVDGTETADLALAWAGTAVSKSGGTMTGNLHTPMVVLGVGTVPASTAINGTIFYDFAGPAYQQTTVDRDVVVSAKNITAGAEISAVLISNGTPRQVTYDAQFSWFGTQVPYMSAIADKKILVPMAATGTTATSVLGATTSQL